jgi:polyhydroxybutyrate depolymerase
MHRTLKNLLLLAIFAASVCAAPAQGTVMTWTVDGVQRTALVFAPPPATSAVKHPLVFAFHGHGGTMQSASQGMHFQTLWPDAIIVYPQGLKTKSRIDPQGNFPGWEVQAGPTNRDVKFFDAMLESLRQKFTIDDQRIYATGFSNGAIFSYTLWGERGKTFAAFGICAGRLDSSETLSLPRAVTVIGGTADPILPFALQQQAIEVARHVDNATGAGQACGQICTLYPSTSQTPVVTRIHNGGHLYPLWASGALVEFFKLHQLP